MARAALFASIFPIALLACSSQSGDPHATPSPDPLGSGMRVADVADPSKSTHPANNANVVLTGAAVLWVDTFDETRNGKSRGTVFVQDVGSNAPYSGISIFSPSFVPADLRIAPGDVMDFNGAYQENTKIGTAIFPTGQVLPQLSKPTATFRYEYQTPDPTEIGVTDLNDYNKGRQWMSMLVTVKNVTIDALSDDGNGRVTAHITSDVSKNGATVSNELFDLQTTAFPAGTKFASITGVVTWFYSFHIAPRSKDDLVVAK